MPSRKHGLINIIFTIIACIIVVALMVWQFIMRGVITKDNWFAVICFYSCFIILAFAMTEIMFSIIDNHIMIKGLRFKIFLIFEKNKNLLDEFQEFCIEDRKKAIIQDLSHISMFCGGKYDESDCLKKYDSNDIEYFLSLTKNCKRKDKYAFKTDIKECFETKGIPAHFFDFQDYYSGQMLQTKKTAGGILVSACSLILGIVSLVSINAFSLLGFEFWFILLSGFVVEIIDTIILWKPKMLRLAKALNSDYNELKKDFDKFLASRESSRINWDNDGGLGTEE